MLFRSGQFYVVSFTQRATKAGKKMGFMVVADHERNLIPVVVFPSVFAQAYMKCEPGTVVEIETKKNKEDTIVLERIL